MQAGFALEVVEQYVVKFLRAALERVALHLSDGWPLTVRVSVVIPQGYVGRTYDEDTNYHYGSLPLVRVHAPVITLPDVFLEEMPSSVPLALRSVFDRLWQSWGYPHSCSYRERQGQRYWQQWPL